MADVCFKLRVIVEARSAVEAPCSANCQISLEASKGTDLYLPASLLLPRWVKVGMCAVEDRQSGNSSKGVGSNVNVRRRALHLG
jgi:hypothetical protein